MSATSDKNQKPAFVYTNLFQLHQKAKEKAEASAESALPDGVIRGAVLKTEDLRAATATPKVSEYRPAHIFPQRTSKPLTVAPAQDLAIKSLKRNLEELNQLHSRLRFMLKELEELVKE